MIWLFKGIEWILNLFLSKKAKQVKQEAFIERQKLLMDYSKAKKKFNNKYSGKRRYTKA